MIPSRASTLEIENDLPGLRYLVWVLVQRLGGEVTIDPAESVTFTLDSRLTAATDASGLRLTVTASGAVRPAQPSQPRRPGPRIGAKRRKVTA